MRAAEADLERGDLAASTCADAITEYIAERVADGRKPTWVTETERRLRQFFPADQEVAGLTAKRAAALYAAYVARNLSVDTNRNVLGQAKTFLRWCVAQRIATFCALDDVAAKGKRRKGKPQLRIDEWRSWEARAFQRASEGDAGAVAALMAGMMGLRASEIVRLVVRDVDDRGRLLWVAADGDGKTDAARREENVPDDLRPFLLALAGQRDGLASLWPQAMRGRRRVAHPSRRWVLKAVQRICVEAKVPVVTAHGMRGLHATVQVLAGRSLSEVARGMGHRSETTTVAHYIDATALRKVMQRQALSVLRGGR